jgi:hypothetical protein
VRTLAPEVPEEFAEIAERCLAQDKAARFPTVAHLAHALAPWATRRGRVLIEQILATLNVTFDGDALDATAAKSPKPKVEPPAPPTPPRALALPQTMMIVGVTLLVVAVGSATCRAVRGPPLDTETAASAAASPPVTSVPPPTSAPAALPTPAPSATQAATEPSTAPAAPSNDPAATSRPKMTPTPLARPKGGKR